MRSINMQVLSINKNHNQHFGNKYKLDNKTIKHIEKSSGLSYKEMTSLATDDAKKLIKERGKLKEPNKFKQWFANKYQQIGERLGFLEKKHNIYTDIC